MYTDIILSFKENIESLEKFVEQVEPTLSNDLNKEKLEVMITKTKVAKAIMDEIRSAIKNNQEPGSVNGKKIKLENGEEIEIDASMLSEDVGDIFEFRDKLKCRNTNYSILYKSALMSLIIYLESTISDVIKETCRTYPQRLGEKSLTLKEVKESGSIDEAISKIVEKEVESLMFKGFDEWIKFLKNNLNLDMKYLDKYQEELTEIISRRNIMVHNRGIVNHTYLSKVSRKYSENIKIGETLKVDRSYIDRSMKVISIVGYLILIDVTLKENRKNKDITEKIGELAFEILCDEKWEVALEIYLLLYKAKGINAKDKLIYQINYCQCYKWLDRYEEIQEEVDRMDLSAHSSLFTLCKYALEDEYEEFFKLLNKDYNSLQESIDLDVWPIFRDIRETKEYIEFKNQKDIESNIEKVVEEPKKIKAPNIEKVVEKPIKIKAPNIEKISAEPILKKSIKLKKNS